VVGYTDSSWGGDIDDGKSTVGQVFVFCNSPIAWSSKKQQSVALSSCEAEYIAASLGACQATWLRNLLFELNLREKKPVRLWIDNKSAISLAKHPTTHGRTKHIDTRYHYLRGQVGEKKLEVEYCCSQDQKADMMTKALSALRFNQLREMLGMKRLEELN
jgi:hypothetical protein